MKDLIESIFGTYSPITYQITEYTYDTSGNVISETVSDAVAAGAAGVDWMYVLGVAAFLVTLYCILRIIGGVINRV